ncbi:MAG: cation:proton antiporter [Chloroflexales bacterium]|nr:cation:proton antiporter [Chloroflexales bacterium]
MLVGAKMAGLASRRIGMPGVLGKLLLGLALGPAIIALNAPTEALRIFGQIGVILVMFIAGMETDLGELRAAGRAATLTAVGGVLLPLGGGFLLGRAFGLDVLPALFLGAVLTATSVSISAEVLRELGQLRSRMGSIIMGAAVIDDVLGVVVLSAVLALAGEGGFWLSMGKMALFLPVAWFVGDWLMPRLVHANKYVPQRETSVAVLIGMLLLYAWGAEVLGSVASITGAYLLGVITARHTEPGHALHDGVSMIGYSLFIPLFFVTIGLEVDASALWQAPALTIAVLTLAVAGKVIGCGLGALVARVPSRESLTIGVGMVARGEVALVMVTAGRAAGLVDDSLYAVAIMMTLATSLATPLLLRWTIGGAKATIVAAEAPVAMEPMLLEEAAAVGD